MTYTVTMRHKYQKKTETESTLRATEWAGWDRRGWNGAKKRTKKAVGRFGKTKMARERGVKK
jgi:hypothetical protein